MPPAKNSVGSSSRRSADARGHPQISPTRLLHKNAEFERRISEEGNRRTDALFALVESVGQAQGTVQRLLREKDPDNIEKLMDQGKAATKAALEKIREAGAGGEVASAFDALGQANEKCTGFLLKGDNGQAQEVLIGESNPSFERLTAAIGGMQEASSRKESAVVAAAEADGSREETTTFVLVGIVLAGLVASALTVVRRISARLSQVIAELRVVAASAASAAVQISASSEESVGH